MSSPAEYAERPISAEAGALYFQKTGGGDPYATGIAYPLFLAMMEAFPEELGRDWNEFSEKFGTIPNPTAKGDPKALPVGFYLTKDEHSGVPWLVANCQLCHADKLKLPGGDVVVTGLGNKWVKPHAYVNALTRIGTSPKFEVANMGNLAAKRAAAWNVPWPEIYAPYITGATVSVFRDISEKRRPWVTRYDAALPGRMATIESFALALAPYTKSFIHLPNDIGWAKVPDVRSVPFRETFSYDASGYGSPQALVLEADFLFGARAEWYVTHPHIATSMYLYLKAFSRKLPFPGPIDGALAERGHAVFDLRCAHCHGVYVDHGDEMRVSYKEKVIPKADIGTDPARTDAVSKEFVTAANDFPLTKGYTAVRNTGGYVPPVLLDIWARGIYGHAGQWPSLAELAKPPKERALTFVVDPKGMYDLESVGVRYEEVRVRENKVFKVSGEPRPLKGSEYLYRGDQNSYRTSGHTFLADLQPADKKAVLEYLKKL